MSRRRDPRPLSEALGALRRGMAPATTLARVQEVWPEVAGEGMGREAQPVSERSGTVTFACRSSVWAGELTLMANDLTGRLNEALGAAAQDGPVRGLRFVTQASRMTP
jgi:predicted nucleic acid-binding Zn ribbon protein